MILIVISVTPMDDSAVIQEIQTPAL